jgi:hypothetical protein
LLTAGAAGREIFGRQLYSTGEQRFVLTAAQTINFDRLKNRVLSPSISNSVRALALAER